MEAVSFGQGLKRLRRKKRGHKKMEQHCGKVFFPPQAFYYCTKCTTSVFNFSFLILFRSLFSDSLLAGSAAI